jgi:hypothetical protein
MRSRPNVGLCARNQGISRPTVTTAKPTLLTHHDISGGSFAVRINDTDSRLMCL